MQIQYKVKSPFIFEETVEKLKESLSKEQFGVLWELNFKDKLQEKGITFDVDFKVLEACNPKKAEKVLRHNIEAGYFLPCKVVVYDLNGEIYMGMLSPTRLIGLIEDEALMPIAEEVEVAIKNAMEDVKNS